MSKKYKNPPIVEALCEFQFEPSTSWDLVMPGLIYDELRDIFPGREPDRVLLQAPSSSGPRVQYSEAISFLSKDSKVSVLIGPNILSVNHLEPYSSWEDFVPLIKRGLNAYTNVVEPEQLQNVELRYINDLRVPKEPSELEHYLNLRPFVDSSLPQNFRSFITGIQVPYEDQRDSLKIEVQGSSEAESDSVRLTLDLDYILLRTEEIDFEDVFDWLDVAHSRVEDAFEACVTDEMKRTFEEVSEL